MTRLGREPKVYLLGGIKGFREGRKIMCKLKCNLKDVYLTGGLCQRNYCFRIKVVGSMDYNFRLVSKQYYSKNNFTQ